jgi:hypothetical protein
MKRLLLLAILSLAFVALFATPASACSACFGKSDSAMARSLNASIFTLMGVIGTVLVGAASFFVFLAKRAAATSHPEVQPTTASSSQPQA